MGFLNQLSIAKRLSLGFGLLVLMLAALGGLSLQQVQAIKGEVHIVTDEAGITVRVHDNGPGVPPDQHLLVFERFRQGGDGVNRPQGTGLGLPISRQIIEHFGFVNEELDAFVVQRAADGHAVAAHGGWQGCGFEQMGKHGDLLVMGGWHGQLKTPESSVRASTARSSSWCRPW